jgi:hypothetical protein
MAAYEDMIRETATDHAPWHVVPADRKEIAWLVVAGAVIDALETLDPKPPKISGARLKELKAAEKALRAQAPRGRRKSRNA